MDALTFGTDLLIRNLTTNCEEINLKNVLNLLGFTYDQFIDLCILCGCDYCDSIKGIGPKTALKLLRKYNSIENIPNVMQVSNLNVIRDLFKNPKVIPSNEIEFETGTLDKEGLIDYLVIKKNFNIDRVNKIIERITNARNGARMGNKKKSINGNNSNQTKIDSFFKKQAN